MARSSREPGTALDYAASPLAGALNREWTLDYWRGARPAPASWAGAGRLAGFERVADVLLFVEQPGSVPEAVEGVLCVLVDRARVGDREAARVLVQYLLPFLVRTATQRYVTGSRPQAIDDLLAVAWEAVRTGVELRGRPAKIALLRTIEQRGLRRPARAEARLGAREQLVASMGESHGTRRLLLRQDRLPPEPSAGEEVVGLLAEARARGLSRDDARLIGELSVGGATCEALGAAEGVTGRTVRNWRAVAIRRLLELSV